jgi:type IV fimbrial biogenesis protein FimT
MRRGVAVGVAAATPQSGSEFTAGWNVFVDSNGNGRFDGGETIVRQEPALHGDLRVSLASGATAVIFNGRGFLTPATMLTFNLCAAAASKSYIVRVEPVGLADVSDGAAGCP